MAKPKKSEKLPLDVDTSGIMETKLTRSEAIELMLQESLDRVETRLKEIEERDRALSIITPEQLSELLGAVAEGVHVNHHNYSNSTAGIALSIRYESCMTPEWFTQQRKEHKSLLEERSHLYEVQRVLQDRGKAKLAIMKQVLEGSEDGRAFLKQVESMSVALNGRLITGAGKAKAQPQITATTTVTQTTKLTIEEG